MFVNACFMDQHLLTNQMKNQPWHVHSKFQNSINLQDERKQQLVVITTTNYPFMPNGIYLEADDFSKILAAIQIGDLVVFSKEYLHFSTHYLLLNQAVTYSSTLEAVGKVVADNQQQLFSYVSQLNKETGAVLSIAEFLEKDNSFSEALQKLCTENEQQQKSGIMFLLGRGKGLTPSGDDMLVGHLAARVLLRKESTRLSDLLLTELSLEQSLTTDVSKHYLLCALSKRFSGPVKELVEALTKENSDEQTQKATEKILQVGHTSGADLLAGFLTTMNYLGGI